MSVPKEEMKSWRRALALVSEIAEAGDAHPERNVRIERARAFFEACGVERLGKLARLLVPDMSAKQLLCVLVPLERVASKSRVTDADMGVLARDSATTNALAATFPLVVVADNMRSAVNIGGVFRTADFVGAQGVWLCGYTATPEHPHVARSAMGAEGVVPWRHFEKIADAIAELKARGVAIYALETAETAHDYATFAYRFPAALLLGNERFGLDPEVLAAADAVIAIPGHGVKNSLNVVSAFAVAAHAMRRHYEHAQ